VTIELVATDPSATHLAVITEPRDEPSRGLQQRLLQLLTPGTVLTRAKIRDTLAVKNERSCRRSSKRAASTTRPVAGSAPADQKPIVPVP
jgi:hypothetical protein